MNTYNNYNNYDEYDEDEDDEQESLARQLLLKSIRQNKISGITSFIQQGYDLHFNNEEAFLYAIDYSELKTIQYLINCGVDFKITEHLALRKALSQKNFTLAQLLIDNGDSFKTFEYHLARSSIEDNNDFITLDFMIDNGYKLNDANHFISLLDMSSPVHILNNLIYRGLNVYSNNNCLLENSILALYSEKEDVFSFLLDNFEYSLEEKNEALNFSLEHGYSSRAFKLLEVGADVTYNNSLFLKKLAQKGDLESIKKIISYGQSSYHQTSLLTCIKYQKVDCFIYLIEKGSFPTVDKKEAFKFALDTGQLSICSYLLNHENLNDNENHDNNEYQVFYLKTLMSAIEEGNISLALLLIKDRTTNLSDLDLLYKCIFSGSSCLPIWNALIEKGVNVLIPDIIASIISRDQLDYFETLVQAGFDIHEQNDKAFILSCDRKSDSISKYLIELGANVNANNGSCILNYIVSFHYKPDLIDLFFSHGFQLRDNLLDNQMTVKEEAREYVFNLSNKIKFTQQLEQNLKQVEHKKKKLKL